MEDKNYLSALKCGLQLKKSGILSLVQDHNLYSHLGDIAYDIMKYDFQICGQNIKATSEGDGLKILTSYNSQLSVFLLLFLII